VLILINQDIKWHADQKWSLDWSIPNHKSMSKEDHMWEPSWSQKKRSEVVSINIVQSPVKKYILYLILSISMPLY
jgi:hypothetical protein